MTTSSSSSESSSSDSYDYEQSMEERIKKRRENTTTPPAGKRKVFTKRREKERKTGTKRAKKIDYTNIKIVDHRIYDTHYVEYGVVLADCPDEIRWRTDYDLKDAQELLHKYQFQVTKQSRMEEGIEYEVEKIVAHRDVGTQRFYQIHWKGWDNPLHYTELEESNMTDCQNILAEYEESLRKEKLVDDVEVEEIQPVEHIEPVESVQPVELVGPVGHVEPMKRLEPLEPVESVESVQPIKPVEPVGHVEPMKRLEPLEPVERVAQPKKTKYVYEEYDSSDDSEHDNSAYEGTSSSDESEHITSEVPDD